MSAAACRPDRPTTPPLPYELWWYILRMATWVPYLLDAEAVCEFSPTIERKRRKDYHQSFITKVYVVQVCKEWHSIATPFLYESILIGRGRTLSKIRDTLTNSQDSDCEHPVGWWTKRLDISMRDGTDTAVNILPSLAAILRCLSNLEIIFCTLPSSIRFPRPTLPALIQDLRTSGHSLRAFHWLCNSDIHAPVGLDTILPLFTNLRTISIGLTPFVSTIECPTVEILSAKDVAKFWMVKLSSLRHLISNGATSSDAELMTCFFKNHGTQLETIQLRSKDLTTTSSWFWYINKFCPNLLRLDLSFSTWDGMSSPDLLIYSDSLLSLGLQSKRKQSPNRSYRCLLLALSTLKVGRSFRFIQFTDPGNFSDLRAKHPGMFRKIVDKVKELGLNVKGPDGLVLV